MPSSHVSCISYRTTRQETTLILKMSLKGALTLGIDRATRRFPKLDAPDIELPYNRQEHLKNNDRGHCHFLKPTGDIGGPIKGTSDVLTL